MTIDTTADLIAVNYTGSLGAMVRQEVKTPIFCQLASVDRREYYAAYDAGFRPEWRVTTNPINYSGQSIIDLETPEGVVRCDIYRTYRKAVDVMELWCVRKNEVAVQTFTLWTAGKRVTIFGAYLTGEDGTQRTETGKIATDTVTLVLPPICPALPPPYTLPPITICACATIVHRSNSVSMVLKRLIPNSKF